MNLKRIALNSGFSKIVKFAGSAKAKNEDKNRDIGPL